MSDFEQLEKELAALTPSPPTREFTQRVERALGDTGTIAMRHSPAVRTQSNDSPLQYGSCYGYFSVSVSLLRLPSYLIFLNLQIKKIRI